MPVLEGEGRTPHGPEVGLEEVRRETVLNAKRMQQPFWRGQQSHDLQPVMEVETQIGSVEDTALPVDQPGV